MNKILFDNKKTSFEMEKSCKDDWFTKQLIDLTEEHQNLCPEYNMMLRAIDYKKESVKHYSQIPFLPAGLFKRLRLSSVNDDNETLHMLTSSGTSAQRKSSVMLDGETRALQQQVLAFIGKDFLGPKRMPMLVIDCPSSVSGQGEYSARAVGIMGFYLFGRGRTFALNDDMSLNTDALQQFLKEHGDEPFLVFGFTYIVWEHFCKELENKDIQVDMSKAVLVHGGGWKKLQSQAVSKEIFKEKLLKVCGISKVHDYYGMAEQAGSIFMECECGHLHCSDFSGILIRRPLDFSVCDVGEKGIIQVLSLVPRSYPGHSILTEDEGVLLGIDDCPCGRKGAYFDVLGRIKNAEVRGCSDTWEKE